MSIASKCEVFLIICSLESRCASELTIIVYLPL